VRGDKLKNVGIFVPVDTEGFRCHFWAPILIGNGKKSA